jgi:hypothetical protein
MRPGDPSHHGRQRRGLGVRLFHWLSAMQIPAAYDLRRRGWCMAERAAARSAAQPAPALAPVDVAGEGRWSFLAPWLHRPLRQQVLLLGVEDSRARARLLRLGFGDVAGADLALDEVEARTIRIAEQAALVPRDRRLEPQRATAMSTTVRSACTRANSRCSGGSPRRRGASSRSANCCAMSGGCIMCPIPTALPFTSRGCGPNWPLPACPKWCRPRRAAAIS